MWAVTVAMILGLAVQLNGHGRLIDPAARNCMWRYGFKNPINYNDDEQNCGAFGTQWVKNKGRCGVCGDAYDPKNQPHSDGGKYANGLIAKSYKQGATIDVAVELTTSHQGWFEFRIGAFDSKTVEDDGMGFLKGYILELATGGTRFNLPKGSGAGIYRTKLNLPAGLTCKRCVMQWWYKTANSWACDKTGCGMGHGEQECFVNCADVQIVV